MKRKPAQDPARKPQEPTFKLPPAAFSNAINDLYKHFDFTTWEQSVEWKLFNVGRASAASDLAAEAGLMFKEAKDKSRMA